MTFGDPPPLPSTPLHGREAELAALRTRLESHRWVTLVGPIGVGKSRLALELAHRAGAPDGRRVLWANPAALSVPPSEPSLLVLDAAGEWPPAQTGRFDALLAAHSVRVLAVGRHPLRLDGEAVLPVPPLAPAVAAALLGERVHAHADPGRPPDSSDDLSAVAEAVDRLPLLLDWVAPYVVTLGAERLAERLELDPFLLLAEGLRDGPSHQRDLAHAVGETLAALAVELRRVLTGAAVFRGPFSLAAAEAVLGPDQPVELEAALAELARRMLLRSDGFVGRPPRRRFAVWSLLRAALAAEVPPAVRERHRAYVLADRRPGAAPSTEIDPRRELRAVTLRLSRKREDRDEALMAAARLAEVTLDHGPLHDVRRLLDETLAAAPTGPGASRAHHARGRIALREGDHDTASRHFVLASEGASPARAAHIETDRARALVLGGDQAGALDRYRVAEAQFRAIGDAGGEARVLGHVATVDLEAGRLDAAEAAYSRVLTLAAASGDVRLEGMALQNLSLIALERGDQVEAERVGELARGLHDDLGHRRFAAVAAFDRGMRRALADRPLAAIRAYDEAARALAGLGDAGLRALVELRRAAARATLGDLRAAAREHRAAARRARSLRLAEALAVGAVERGHQELADARRAWVASGLRMDGTVLEHLDRAEARLALNPDARGEQVRLSRRCLALALEAGRRPETALLVAADRRWFIPPGAMRVDLGRSAVLRAGLGALVDARLDQGGHRAVSRDHLQHAIWPGERMRSASARNRLDVALSKLRSRGLEPVLRRGDAGYALDPDVPLAIIPPPAP